MKIYALFVLVIMAVLAFANAADTCTFDGKTLKKGESYQTPGECAQKTCQENGHFSAVGCPPIAASPHCKPVEGDNSKPYPDCCPSYNCKH